MNSTSATGYDGISAKTLKEYSVELAPTISSLINSEILASNFPNNLKIARVKPVLKKGNKLDCPNYRAISILPQPSKIYECVIYDRLYQYLFENNIINQN